MAPKTHLMHGRDHCPGGADPIPCLTPPVGVSFPDAIAEIGAAHPGSLLGYWRLGDGGEPFLDTSGHAYGPADAVKETTGTAMTDSITGALPAGADDGAVKFNNTTGAAAVMLHAADPSPFRFDTPGSQTIMAWLKPAASASSFIGMALGNWVSLGGPSPVLVGYRLTVAWPSRAPSFTRKNVTSTVTISGAALPADEWAFIVGTYDATNGHRLYVNAALVATDATVLASGLGGNVGPKIGGVGSFGGLGTTPDSFAGGIDEVSIWNVALSDVEIAALYTAGVAAGSAADKVLTALGDGSTSWEYPTVDVDGTRYDEILAGANLASTDNGDGTVTLDASAGAGPPTGPAGGALDGSYPNPGLAASVAGAGLSEASDVLSVNVDGSTLEISSDTLRVKADGITAAQIAADAVGSSEIAAGAVGSSELADTAVTPGSYGDATNVATFTVDQDGRLTAAGTATISSGGVSPSDVAGWMPLTTVVGGVPDLVWDATDSLIPTYGPF